MRPPKNKRVSSEDDHGELHVEIELFSTICGGVGCNGHVLIKKYWIVCKVNIDSKVIEKWKLVSIIKVFNYVNFFNNKYAVLSQ